jgi:hypothetical protein
VYAHTQASPAPVLEGTLSLTPRGDFVIPLAFSPILQPPGAPPLKSVSQITQLEIRNADPPSQSIHLEIK